MRCFGPISVEIYEEDAIATADDKKVYAEAVEDLKNGKTVSLEAYINKNSVAETARHLIFSPFHNQPLVNLLDLFRRSDTEGGFKY